MPGENLICAPNARSDKKGVTDTAFWCESGVYTQTRLPLHETFCSSPFHLLCAAMAQLEQELLEFGYSAGL